MLMEFLEQPRYACEGIEGVPRVGQGIPAELTTFYSFNKNTHGSWKEFLICGISVAEQ